MIKKLLLTIAGIGLITTSLVALPLTTFAVQVSVPSGTSAGLLLQSLSSGNWGLAQLIAGTNVTISSTTNAITISASGGGGSSTFGTTSLSATSPLNWNTSTANLTITQSGTGANGYLSSTNFNTFNNKISSTSLSITTIGSSGPATYTPSTGVFNIPQYSGGTNFWTQQGNAIYNNTGQSVGINVQSPTAVFELQATSSAPAFIAWDTTARNIFQISNNGQVGVSTSSPFAQFAIHALNGSTNTSLFAIASSTSGATTTLFSIDNTGAISAASGGFIVNKTGNVGIGTAPTGVSLITLAAIRAGTSFVGSNGTVAFPTYSFNADQSTGLYTPNNGSGRIGVVSGGNEIARFTENGSFGLGTTTPYALLSIAATSTNGLKSPTTLFAIASSTGGTATTTLFTVDNVGNVTTTGSLSLPVGSVTLPSVNFGTSGTGFYRDGTNTVGLTTLGGVQFSFGTSITTNTATGPQFKNVTSNTQSTPSIIPNRTDATTGFASGATGNINAIVGGVETVRFAAGVTGVGTTSPYAQLSIHTNNGSTNTTLFAIGSSTQAATTTLFSVSNTGSITANVAGSSASFAVVQSNTFRDPSGNNILLAQSTAFARFGNTNLARLNFGGDTNASVALQRNGVGSNGTALSIILADGSLGGFFGIGTTSPDGKLSVHANAGETYASNFLFDIASSTASATTTLFSVSNIGSTTLGKFGACSGTNALNTDSNGSIICGAVSGGGVSTYDFPLAGNATSTLTQFNGGITAYATSTIGGGTQATGLTINGGATTTLGLSAGYLNLTGSTVPTNGVYLPSANQINFATNGTARLALSTTLFNTTVPITGTNGASFQLNAGGSSATVPTLIPNRTDTTTGIGASAASALSLITAGVDRVEISSTGNVGVASTSPFANLVVQANNGATNTTLFAIGSSTQSATTTLFSISNTGSTTASNGINLTAGCYAFAGACLTAGAIGGGSTQAVNWATTAVLAGTPTYSNGTAGVGGTLTEIGTGALSVDSNSPAAGDRVLVKNQASALQNGIYTVTATGSGIASYILTRATDYNSPTEITPGLNTYVLTGTANSDTTWAVSFTPPLVIGTNSLTYAESAGTNGTVTSVAASVPNFLSISGSPVTTSGTLAIGYSGTALPIANGGTNATSFGTTNGITSFDGTRLVNFSNYTLTSSLLSTLNASSTQFSATRADFGGTATSTFTAAGTLGIGSTTPFAKLSIQANIGETNRTLFAISSSTASGTTVLYSIDNMGRIFASSTRPTLTNCGSAATILNNSTDMAGAFAVGGASSNSCTLVFSHVYGVNPMFCVVTDSTIQAGDAISYGPDNTGFSVTFSTTLGNTFDGHTIYYNCGPGHY